MDNIYIMLLQFLIAVFASAKDSSYIGTIKYSLLPSQSFEHQFFDIKSIASMDLYYPDPPYKKVEDQFMDCYWSFQPLGLQEYMQVDLPVKNSFDSNLICFDRCYLRQDFQILTQDKVFPLEVDSLALLPQNSVGKLLFYNSKSIVVFDTLEGLVDNQGIDVTFADALHKSRSSLEHFDNQILFTCSQDGVHSFTHQYQLLLELKSDKNETFDCQSLFLQDDTLFVAANGLYLFDINDPLWPRFLINLNMTADYYDVHNSYIGMLIKRPDHFMVKVLNYTMQSGPEELVNLTILLEGQVPNTFQSSDIGFSFLNDDVAVITGRGSVTLVSLKTSQHQRIRHNNSLVFSEHILSPENRIFVAQGSIIQADQSLHFYNITNNEIYNLVCTAPSSPQRFVLYGLIRSEEKCKAPTANDKLKQLVEQESEKNVKCYYTFQLNVTVNQGIQKWSHMQIILLSIFLVLLVIILIQYYKSQQKSQMIDSLKKFEQLNQLNLQKQKIRITHDEEEGNSSKFYNDLI